MSSPKVSVIIIVYNAAAYIERAARSLFSQTLDDIEYIFVNDATPDNSFVILDKVLKEFPHRKNQVKVINQPKNSRQAAARTAGMMAATGEYMIHCDPDDWMEHDAYATMYRRAKETGADIVNCKALRHQGESATECEQFFEGDPRTCLYDFNFGAALWAKLVNTDLIQRNNIYPFEGIDNGEDLNVTVRLLLKANKIAFVNRALYHYNADNPNSINNSAILEKFEKYQVRNIELISEYFNNITDPRKEDFLNRLKFNIKYPFFKIKGISREQIKKLINLWPESNQSVANHPVLSRKARLLWPILLKYPFLLQFATKCRRML